MRAGRRILPPVPRDTRGLGERAASFAPLVSRAPRRCRLHYAHLPDHPEKRRTAVRQLSHQGNSPRDLRCHGGSDTSRATIRVAGSIPRQPIPESLTKLEAPGKSLLRFRRMEMDLAILLDLDDLNSSIQGEENPRETSIAEFERVTPITELVSFQAFGQPSHDRGNTASVS